MVRPRAIHSSSLSHFLADAALPRRVVDCRGLVAAGLKDLSRPAEVISIPQNLGSSPPSLPLNISHTDTDAWYAALTATGLIWVRYSFVITPVNYSLAAVNMFVAGTGITSLYRALE